MTDNKNSFDLHNPEPLLIVVSGPSGVGKDSVIEQMKARGLPFHFIITATNRPPRDDETHGLDYFFYSTAEFKEMIAQDELLEYANVYDAYKGVPKSQVREALASGKDVVMRLDVQGAASIHEICPDAVLVFLTTKSEAELIDRLEARATESPEELKLRITTARDELNQIDKFDYIIPNCDGKLDQAVDIIAAIIQAEHHQVNHRKVTM